MNLTTLTRPPINSVSDLMTWGDHLERLNKLAGPMLFRGQAEQFQNLAPTLSRAARNGNQPVNHQAVVLLETSLLDGFRTHYSQVQGMSQDMPLSGELMTRSKLEVLSLMQHYEVPSRLLDWSESVWIATFFACASSPQKDAELWFFDEAILDLTPSDMPTAEIRRLVEESIGNAPPAYHQKWGMPYLAVVQPMQSSRLTAQRGKLTACVNAQSDHAGLLWRLATMKRGGENTGDLFGRHVIRADRKSDILKYLERHKGISAKTLFPDIVGLQRYLRWEFESLRTQLL
jgi:FRG domain